MEKRFTVKSCGDVELNVQGKIEVLKRDVNKGWVVEKKLLNMMELISNQSVALNFETLAQLEVERPAWTGVILSLFDHDAALCH